MALNLPELEMLAAHRAKITQEIKNLEQARKDYDQKILDLLGTDATGTQQAGEYKITITRPRILDKTKLEAAYPITQHPEYYTAHIDTTTIKKHIPETKLAEYQTERAPQIRIA